MARKEVVEHVCDRCPPGRERPAVMPAVRLTLGTTTWELELCAEHTSALERDIHAWGRLGREKDADTRFSTAYRANAARVAELRTVQAAQDREEDEARRAEVLRLFTPRELVSPLDDVLEHLPAEAGNWVFTNHAKERLEERGVSVRDALMAACKPRIRRPARHRELSVHIGAAAKAVVDPVNKVIVTVAVPDAITRRAN